MKLVFVCFFSQCSQCRHSLHKGKLITELQTCECLLLDINNHNNPSPGIMKIETGNNISEVDPIMFFYMCWRLWTYIILHRDFVSEYFLWGILLHVLDCCLITGSLFLKIHFKINILCFCILRTDVRDVFASALMWISFWVVKVVFPEWEVKQNPP